jgi:hypothetical protein
MIPQTLVDASGRTRHFWHHEKSPVEDQGTVKTPPFQAMKNVNVYPGQKPSPAVIAAGNLPAQIYEWGVEDENDVNRDRVVDFLDQDSVISAYTTLVGKMVSIKDAMITWARFP